MQIHFRLENAEDTEHPSDGTFFFLVITVLLLLLFHSLTEWTLIVPPNLPESKGGTQESCKNEPRSPPIGNILELIWSMFRECLFLPRRASCVPAPLLGHAVFGFGKWRWLHGVHGVHGVTEGWAKNEGTVWNTKIHKTHYNLCAKNKWITHLTFKIECPFGQIGHKLKPGKSWFHLSLRQGGVGEGVPGNARTLRGCLVLHHPLIMLASAVIATIYQGLSPQPLNHACRASSSLEPPYVGGGHSWAPEKLFSSSQAAPRHEKLWGSLGPISPPSHDRTCKQDSVTSHSLHESTSDSLGLSKPHCCFSGVFLLPGCWESPYSWSHTPAWASVRPYPRLQKNTPLVEALYFPSNSSLSPKLRKSEALLFTFAAFFFPGFGFGNSKARRGFPFSAFG